MSGAGGASPAPAGFRMLCIGDSYTVGEGVEPAHTWPHLLADRVVACGVGATLRVVGKTGLSTAELHAVTTRAELQPPYGLVTVQAGVNDQYRGRTPESYAIDLDRLLGLAARLAGDRPGRVLMVSIPDWSVTPHGADFDRGAVAAAIDTFNRTAASVCLRTGIEFVDITTISRAGGGDPESTTADGLHPSAPMYRRWLHVVGPAAERITEKWN